MTFKAGNHPVHDVAKAGRKGKANSPWARTNGFMFRHDGRERGEEGKYFPYLYRRKKKS